MTHTHIHIPFEKGRQSSEFHIDVGHKAPTLMLDYVILLLVEIC